MRKALMAGARKAPYRLRRDETIVRGPVALMKRMVRGMRIRMVLGRGHLWCKLYPHAYILEMSR